jgi:serine/threonine protein kinase
VRRFVTDASSAHAQGKLPFDDENMHLLLGKVKSGYFAMPQWLPSDVKDLLQRMLTVDPAKRIMLHQIFAHPALTHASQDYVGPTSLPLEQKIARPLDDEPLDDEILRSLHSLGWDNREELHRALLSSEPTVEKAYYRLLSKRKRRRTKGRRSGGGHVQKVQIFSQCSPAQISMSPSRSQRPTSFT